MDVTIIDQGKDKTYKLITLRMKLLIIVILFATGLSIGMTCVVWYNFGYENGVKDTKAKEATHVCK